MFKGLLGYPEARDLLLRRCNPVLYTEDFHISDSIDRVLSNAIISPVDLPAFNRAAMDGFAVRSIDTMGSSPISPVFLDEFQPIRTGMVVPDKFDAVVMLEDTVKRGLRLEVTSPVHPFRNVSLIGEDVRRGDLVLNKGHRLRPPDIALIAALGIISVSVFRKPKVAIFPTGEELVPRWERMLLPGEVYETNGLMASLYAEKWGGDVSQESIVPDDPKKINDALMSAKDSDMIIILGGTSVGEKDYAPSVLAKSGELLVHGVRVQPGKPTAFGVIANTPVVCLPGYPVAALSGLHLFIRPALQKMAHLNISIPRVSAPLERKIASRPGYISFSRVALRNSKAEPIMTAGAGILSSVARADGYVIVPEEREGIEAGEIVGVHMFE